MKRTAIYCSVLLLAAIRSTAQSSQPQRAPHVTKLRSAEALLISDIHFDPFEDPAKVRQLATTSIEGWTRVLNGAPSAGQASAYASVRSKCGKDVFDTSPALLHSTTKAVAIRRHSLSFAVLTGDLIAHDFFCRYEAVMPGSSREDARLFLERTIEYVVRTVSRALGSKPLYVALGNNDSDCGDYRLDQDDPLFPDLLGTVARAARVAASALSAEGFATSGRFTVLLPSPIQHTRIVVMDDLPLSSRFQSCTAERKSNSSRSDLLWLEKQLQLARLHKQKVWFAAHIPPGVDPRPTLFGKDVCTSRKPTMLLSSNELATMLADYADVVSLALFAHTHMDEVRVFEGDPAAENRAFRGVPVKLVPSISPVAGNRPSFLIARVNPTTAIMSDYTQYAVPALERTDGPWLPVYSFRQAYAEPDFSAPALEDLLHRFKGNSPQAQEEVTGYVKRYSSGAPKYGISPVWTSYRCIFTSQTSDQFLNCACPAANPSAEKAQ